MIFNTVSGGMPLNFKVVGNPKPDTPRENTIWIDTDTPINGWTFSSTEPENPNENMVWFAVGTASPASFNLLKKNSIMIYPLRAKQYVDGAWGSVACETYQEGAWKNWSFYLYNYGDQFTEFTQGWKATKASGCTVTFNAANMKIAITGTSNRVGGMYTIDKIDLSEFTKLCVTVSKLTHDTAGDCSFGIGVLSTPYTSNSSISGFTSNCAASKKVTSEYSSQKTITLDISGIESGSYHIQCLSAVSNVTIVKVWLE